MRPIIKGKSACMQGKAWADGVYCCTIPECGVSDIGQMTRFTRMRV
jgi:hypothetical protein